MLHTTRSASDAFLTSSTSFSDSCQESQFKKKKTRRESIGPADLGQATDLVALQPVAVQSVSSATLNSVSLQVPEEEELQSMCVNNLLSLEHQLEALGVFNLDDEQDQPALLTQEFSQSSESDDEGASFEMQDWGDDPFKSISFPDDPLNEAETLSENAGSGESFSSSPCNSDEEGSFSSFYSSSEESSSKPLKDCFIKKESLPVADMLRNALHLMPSLSIHCMHKTHDGIGRETNEDRFFVFETDDYVVGCVFDGFSGIAAANLAKMHFENSFHRKFVKNNGDFKKTVQDLFNKIQAEAEKTSDCIEAGTTACVTLIDKRTGLIVSGSVGDSETFVYDVEAENCFPSSCKSDWTTKKDFKRALGLYAENPDAYEFQGFWSKRMPRHSKTYRVNERNNSSALGATSADFLSRTGEFTLNSVKSGNIVIMASDGLWDYLEQNKIAKIVKQHQDNLEKMAEALTTKAVENMGFKGDNVTVLIFKPALGADSAHLSSV